MGRGSVILREVINPNLGRSLNKSLFLSEILWIFTIRNYMQSI